MTEGRNDGMKWFWFPGKASERGKRDRTFIHDENILWVRNIRSPRKIGSIAACF